MLIELIVGICVLSLIITIVYNFPEVCINIFFIIIFSILFIGGAWGFGKATLEVIKWIHVF